MTLREHLFHLAGRLARLTGEIAAAETSRDAAIARAAVAERIAREAHFRERALWDANRQLEAALRREISARMASDTVLAIMAGEGTALIIPLPELALHAGLERRGH
jgi:hypothetical protein